MTRVNKIILFLLSIITINLFSQEKWEVLENKEYNFKISFPAKYTQVVDTIPFEKFKAYKHFWEVEYSDSTHGDVYLNISVLPYPSDFINSDSSEILVESYLNSIRNDFLEEGLYSLMSATVIEKDGYQGRKFSWNHIKKGELITAQTFLIDSVLYTLFVSTYMGVLHEKYCEDYFSTFELLNKKKGKYALLKPDYKPTFFIDFPETPVLTTQILPTDSIKLVVYSTSLDPEDKTENLTFFANEVKYPDIFGVLDDYKYNLIYLNTLQASVSRLTGDISVLKDINYEGNPGKECKAYLYKGQAFLVIRTFIINNVLYQYGVVKVPKYDGNYEMKKFLDSFKVL